MRVDVKKILSILKKHTRTVSLFYLEFIFNSEKKFREQTQNISDILSFFDKGIKNKLMMK